MRIGGDKLGDLQYFRYATGLIISPDILLSIKAETEGNPVW